MQRYSFSLLVLPLLLIFINVLPAQAHSGHIEHDGIAQAASPSIAEKDSDSTESAEVVEEEVQYELPYPGMLPDSPLYFLKTFRDAVVKFLISDPLKEAEFNVLTANKRAYASLLLAEKDKPELALETLSKSNNYLHEAIVSAGKAKEKKMNIGPVLDSLKNSVKKHEMVFSRQIMPIIPENMKDRLEQEMERLLELEKSVSNLESK